VIQNANVIQSRRNYQPTEVIRHPIFWLMYFMFVNRGRRRIDGHRQSQADRRRLEGDSVPVTLMAMTMTAVTFAATIAVSSTV